MYVCGVCVKGYEYCDIAKYVDRLTVNLIKTKQFYC